MMSLFGPEFRAGGPVLTILAAGQYVNVLTGSVGYLLMMTGNERLVRNNMAVAALLNSADCELSAEELDRLDKLIKQARKEEN